MVRSGYACVFQSKPEVARPLHRSRRNAMTLLAVAEMLTGVLVVLESILGPLVVAMWEAAGQ